MNDWLDRLEAQLRTEEGVRDKVYNDSLGIPTIGVGRNLRDKGLSDEEISFLLRNDIKECVDKLSSLPVFEKLSDNRKIVLTDMCFNLGYSGLCQFKNMLRALDEDRFADAADAMLASKWAKQVGNRALKLHEMMLVG